MTNDSDFLDLAKMRQRYFFPNYQATGSLRNDKQRDSIPPWKASLMICPKWRANALGLNLELTQSLTSFRLAGKQRKSFN